MSSSVATLRSAAIDRASALSTDTGLTPARWLVFLNAAARQIALEHDWFWLEAVANISVLAGTTDYALPASYLRTEGVVNDLGRPVALVPKLAIYEYQQGTRRPLAYTILGSNVVLGPTPDTAYTFKHVYIKAETTATGDSDTFLIPVEFENGLVEYAVYLALRYLRQEDRAGEALAAYHAWLERTHDNRLRTREPQRVRVRPGAGW